MPVALEILKNPTSINPQSDSLLISKLPLELRRLIWAFALTCYEDKTRHFALDRPYTRPGQGGPLRVATDLLETCRTIYVEAFLVPFEVNPMTAFDGNHVDVPPHTVLHCTDSGPGSLGKLKRWQFANLTSAEMTVQQVKLEGGAIERISRMAGTLGRHRGRELREFTFITSFVDQFLRTAEAQHSNSTGKEDPMPTAPNHDLRIAKKMTHLTIRLGRTDWWSWSSAPERATLSPGNKLRLEPMIHTTASLATAPAMNEGYAARQAGREPEFGLDSFEKPGRWGTQITEFWPDLQVLELVLETFIQKKSQLDAIIECAKLWTFALPEGYQLEWDQRPVSTIRWRGAMTFGYLDPTVKAWAEINLESPDPEAEKIPLLDWRRGNNSIGHGSHYHEAIIHTMVFKRRKL
ncbi:hypothetical protein F5Y15DRAFT_413011 [Xylariaceae sp. FL0016]|nr:hypothetical protein F5Y15DRAFT_413011 [Xylariaceae sp. FL0016]